MDIALNIESLTKIYYLGRSRGQKRAVDSLSLQVPEGVVFGFLGPNGAGKTTTIKMLLDFVRPTSGVAEIFGRPTGDVATRSLVGYLPEQPYFHKFLKPMEVVCMHAALAGVESREVRDRAMRAMKRVGIAEYADIPISKLSKGLTQRVGIAQAIVADPKLLILDEPTSGLDPIGRRHTRDLLLELKAEGKTIFLSSHLLGEVENICDIVAVLKSGKLAACGPPDKVRSGSSNIVVETVPLTKDIVDRLKFMDVVVDQRSDCSLLTINQKNIYEVMRAMEELQLPISKIETRRESLEEAFLRLAA